LGTLKLDTLCHARRRKQQQTNERRQTREGKNNLYFGANNIPRQIWEKFEKWANGWLSRGKRYIYLFALPAKWVAMISLKGRNQRVQGKAWEEVHGRGPSPNTTTLLKTLLFKPP